ncbi:MAG: Vitamin transporter BtuB precursor [Pseudomonadota bacterium]|jgi:vitamin B12 transporter
MKLPVSLCAAGLCLTLLAPARANEVVITATRIPTLASSVIPAVTVYSRAEIEASGAWSLADLIANQPGVEIGRNGGEGAVTSFFLRGAESKNVLVLVDGQRMRDGVTQSSLAENIPLDLVERVEVIRGNVSALYGDGAVGGVILVTTRNDQLAQSSRRISLGLGNEAARRIGLSLAAPLGSAQVQLGLSHVALRGASATDPSKTFSTDPSDADRDPYERTAIQLGVNASTLGGRLAASHQSTWSHLRFDNDWMGMDPRQASLAELSSLGWTGPLAGDWQQTLSVQRAEHRIETNTGSRNLTETVQTSWTLSGAVGPGRLLAGLELRDDDRSPADGETATRSTPSQFVTWMFDPRTSALSAQIALRHDEPSDLRSRVTYLAGLGWRLNGSTRLTASVSTAFRVPDGYALSTNPALLPEDTRSAELGLHWQPPNGGRLSLVVFKGRTDNPIFYDDTYTARNLAEMKNQGLELEATVPLQASWQLRMSLTGQNPKSPLAIYGAVVQPTVWVQSARRAKWFGETRLEGRLQNTQLVLKLSGASARRNTDSDPMESDRLAGYALASITAQRRLGRGLSAGLSLNNLLDHRYSLAEGYPAQGRRMMLNLHWQD